MSATDTATAYFESECRRCNRHVERALSRTVVGGNHDGIHVRCRECGSTNWCEHTVLEVDKPICQS